MVNNKIIMVDTREKPRAIESILDYFSRNGYDYERSKLLFGDYCDYSNPNLVIDRKQSIQELAQNCTRDHERFRRELERAKKTGSHLVILVEQNRYRDRDEWIQVRKPVDLIRWSSPHTMVRGEKVYRVLASWTAKFPISVVFCDKRSTGRMITEILYNGRFTARTEDIDGK